MKVALISCSKLKNKGLYQVKDLYCSPLFKKSFSYAIKNFDDVYILSAKYGLLNKKTEIRDYNMTLNDMKKEQIIEWSKNIANQINQTFNKTDKIYIIAGKKYYEELLKYLDVPYEIVFENLSIGKKMQILNENIKYKTILKC